MKIKVKEAITDYQGKPVMVPNDDGTEKPLTYFDVFINALNSQANGEGPLTAEKKNEVYQTSKKIYTSNEPNFTPEQLNLIKERVGRTYAAMVYGKICELIDGVQEPKEEAPAETTPSN